MSIRNLVAAAVQSLAIGSFNVRERSEYFPKTFLSLGYISLSDQPQDFLGSSAWLCPTFPLLYDSRGPIFRDSLCSSWGKHRLLASWTVVGPIEDFVPPKQRLTNLFSLQDVTKFEALPHPFSKYNESPLRLKPRSAQLLESSIISKSFVEEISEDHINPTQDSTPQPQSHTPKHTPAPPPPIQHNGKRR